MVFRIHNIFHPHNNNNNNIIGVLKCRRSNEGWGECSQKMRFSAEGRWWWRALEAPAGSEREGMVSGQHWLMTQWLALYIYIHIRYGSYCIWFIIAYGTCERIDIYDLFWMDEDAKPLTECDARVCGIWSHWDTENFQEGGCSRICKCRIAWENDC